MNDADVHIITLKPMYAASAYGYGHNPEEQAWEKMAAWARPKGFLNDIPNHPVYGFDNPDPAPSHPKYGYEFWMKVDSGAEPEGEIRIIGFLGGTYAAARCEACGDPATNVFAAWQDLAGWCKKNNHQFAHHQPLEKIISGIDTPDQLVLELYCPIVD